jgi:hypothetical protein
VRRTWVPRVALKLRYFLNDLTLFVLKELDLPE